MAAGEDAAPGDGAVEAIFVGAEAELVPAPVHEAEVVAGQGVRGDRYFRAESEGTFSKPGKSGQDPGREDLDGG